LASPGAGASDLRGEKFISLVSGSTLSGAGTDDWEFDVPGGRVTYAMRTGDNDRSPGAIRAAARAEPRG
jgi:hypothetical protein